MSTEDAITSLATLAKAVAQRIEHLCNLQDSDLAFVSVSPSERRLGSRTQGHCLNIRVRENYERHGYIGEDTNTGLTKIHEAAVASGIPATRYIAPQVVELDASIVELAQLLNKITPDRSQHLLISEELLRQDSERKLSHWRNRFDRTMAEAFPDAPGIRHR